MAGNVPTAVTREMRRRLNNMTFRGVVARVRDRGAGLEAQVHGRDGELRDGVVMVYPYGFDAFPLAAEGGHGPEGVVVLLEGNSRAMLPPMDRRHRAKSGVAEAGEAALYTSKARITIKANGDIEVVSPGKVSVTAPELVDIDTPLLRCSGDILDNYGTGNASTMRGMREVYDIHTHPENDEGGPTSPPNQPMG